MTESVDNVRYYYDDDDEDDDDFRHDVMSLKRHNRRCPATADAGNNGLFRETGGGEKSSENVGQDTSEDIDDDFNEYFNLLRSRESEFSGRKLESLFDDDAVVRSNKEGVGEVVNIGAKVAADTLDSSVSRKFMRADNDERIDDVEYMAYLHDLDPHLFGASEPAADGVVTGTLDAVNCDNCTVDTVSNDNANDNDCTVDTVHNGNANGNNCIVNTVSNGNLDDTDPHYKKFLDDLRVDGPSYVLELHYGGLIEILKYETDNKGHRLCNADDLGGTPQCTIRYCNRTKRVASDKGATEGLTLKERSLKNKKAGVVRMGGVKGRRTSLLDTRICKPTTEGSTVKERSFENKKAGVVRMEGGKRRRTSLVDTSICEPATEGSTVKESSLKNKKAGVVSTGEEERSRTSLLDTRICKPATEGSTVKERSFENKKAGVVRMEGGERRRSSLVDTGICEPATEGPTVKEKSLKNKKAGVVSTGEEERSRTSLFDTRICKPATEGSTVKERRSENKKAGVVRMEGGKRRRTSLVDTIICEPATEGSTVKERSLKNKKAGIVSTGEEKRSRTSLLNTRIWKPATEGSTAKERSLKNKKIGVVSTGEEERRRTNLLNDFSVNRRSGCMIKEEIPEVYVNPLKKDRNHVVFNIPINVNKQKFEEDNCSTDREVIILDTDSVYAHLNSTPFETSKSLVLNDDGKPFDQTGDTNSPFRDKLLEILRKPYDEQEYRDLSYRAAKRKPIERDRNLRGRSKICPTHELGLSNLDQYEDFAWVLAEARGDKPMQLKLLRGFFYWMEKHVVRGAFKPWLDSSLQVPLLLN